MLILHPFLDEILIKYLNCRNMGF